MKKRVLLFASTITLLFLVSSCGNWSHLNELKVKDMITEETISIPMQSSFGYQSIPTAMFATNSDLEGLGEQLEGLSCSTQEIRTAIAKDSRHLLIVVSEEENSYLLLISEKDKASLQLPNGQNCPYDHVYLFSDFSAHLQNDDQIWSFIFPYHLSEDDTLMDLTETIVPGEIYQMSEDFTDFLDFYNSFAEIYNIREPYTVKGNQIILSSSLVRCSEDAGKSLVMEYQEETRQIVFHVN